jgi:hypothetical protein
MRTSIAAATSAATGISASPAGTETFSATSGTPTAPARV